MKKRGVVLAYGPRWIKKEAQIGGFRRIPDLRGQNVGLYVLYKNEEVVYIGKSESNLRRRLREHTKDHLENKWDAFSWFITRKKYVSDLEALLHRAPFRVKCLNRCRAKFIEAKRISGC